MNWNRVIDLEIKNFYRYKRKWNVESETVIKPGLESMLAALEKLHNPQNKHQVIHVAGTNGKGSTIAFMKEIAKEHGYTYGVFTSPCLVDVHDQIQINGNNVTEEQMDRAFQKIQAAGLSGKLTEFELLTVVAFLVFEEQTLDVIFVEAGMGGRFDSTNVFQQSIGVVPSISIDHTNFLGDTIEKITWHKAGILKNKGKLIIGDLPVESKNVIYNEVKEKNANIIELKKDIIIKDNSFFYKDYKFTNLYPCMIGIHQLSNMALAIVALLEAGLELEEQKVRKAVGNASLLGRMERVNERVYMDGAHNQASVEALVDTIKREFPKQKIHFIVGILKDKEYIPMLRKLEEVGDSFEFVKFTQERALSPEFLYEACSSIKKSITYDMQKVNLENTNENSITIVTGSLYLISEIRKINR